MNPKPASDGPAAKLPSKTRNPNHHCFGCQKPICNINHFPDVTDEARARIIAEKFSPAANTRSKAAGSASAANRPDHKSPSCIPCLLNNCVDCTARLDSGADDTFVPSTIIERLHINEAPARIQNLSLPLQLFACL
jgi:hypothetical protein